MNIDKLKDLVITMEAAQGGICFSCVYALDEEKPWFTAERWHGEARMVVEAYDLLIGRRNQQEFLKWWKQHIYCDWFEWAEAVSSETWKDHAWRKKQNGRCCGGAYCHLVEILRILESNP